MKLKSTFTIEKSTLDISYEDHLFFIGSCFSENISERLSKRKFNCHTNPFGIAYNPISIFKNLDFILKQNTVSKTDLFCEKEIWSSFEFHSDMSALNPEDVLSRIAINAASSLEFLKKANTVFITFGTAWVYEEKASDLENKIVANCHKLPSNLFFKRCLSVAEIVQKAKESISLLQALNKDLSIVFTLSPVRHLKDGFVENNLSKSILNVAIHQIVTSLENCSYFPAYEFVMDDLRDYRFYKEDLVHPNKLAIDYIFEQFIFSFISASSFQKLKQVEKVLNMLQHKVNFKQTEAYKQFELQLLTKIEYLETQGLDFSEEKLALLS